MHSDSAFVEAPSFAGRAPDIAPGLSSRRSAHDAAPASSSVAVALAGIRFSWSARAADVIDIESLTIARGERVFLRGPSGSGKSTLLNLMSGVITPTAGSISALGCELSSLGGAARDRFRADHLGYVFQLFNLIPYLTVVENVWLPCRFSSRRRIRAERNAGAVEAEALRLLRQLDVDEELVGRRACELSVGQQQRVAAARALIGAPELLIADEPTSSLDADRRDVFLELLFRQCARENTTLVFASHDASLASRFDRAIELGGPRQPG